MLSVGRGVRVYFAREPADMRNGIDGLVGLVKQFGGEAFSGHLFVFVSRRRDRLKILAWDTGGFVVYYKRLEKNRLKLPRLETGQTMVSLDATELRLLLDGIEFTHLRRPSFLGTSPDELGLKVAAIKRLTRNFHHP